MARQIEVKAGDKFNRLTIIREVESRRLPCGKLTRYVLCKCDCGREVVEALIPVVRGNIKGCKCGIGLSNTITHSKVNRYILKGDIVEVYDNKNHLFIIDAEDLDKIKLHYFQEDGHGYIRCPKLKVSLHRYLMQPSESMVVDHINGDASDNRKSNLRVCSQKENMLNQHKVKGFSFKSKLNKWQAYIGYNGKTIHLGYYKTADEAKAARREAELKYFGDYARKVATT